MKAVLGTRGTLTKVGEEGTGRMGTGELWVDFTLRASWRTELG